MRSFGFCFGIVWCWRSTSCFRLLASLPYMSISAGVVLAVALQKINAAPDAQSAAQSDHDSLQSVHCAVEKFHKWPHFLPRFAAHKIV